MNIATAQKKIKRLKGNMAELQGKMLACISIVEEDEYIENYNELEKTFKEKQAELIKLKNDVIKINVKYNMQEKIFLIGELRSELTIIRNFNTRSGTDRGSFGEKSVKYKSQITYKEKNQKTKDIETKIENLIDELDEFNNKTLV